MSMDNPIVISALVGGAAETVLRCIGQDTAGARISRLGFIWRSPSQGLTIGEGKIRVDTSNPCIFHDVLLVLGEATGLYLEDRWLSGNKEFSLAYLHDCKAKDIQYAVAVSKNAADFRRISNQVVAFALKHHADNFKKLREGVLAAEAGRKVREEANLLTYLQAKRISHLPHSERSVGMYGGW